MPATWFFGLAGSHIRGRNLITGVPLLKIMPDQLATTLGVRMLDRKLTVAARCARGRRQEEGGHPGQPGALRQSRSAAERGLQHRQPLSRLPADRGHHGGSLGIDNLFNKQYAPYLNTYAGGTTGSTLLPFPSPGITVKGELKVRLGGEMPAAPIKVAQAR